MFDDKQNAVLKYLLDHPFSTADDINRFYRYDLTDALNSLTDLKVIERRVDMDSVVFCVADEWRYKLHAHFELAEIDEQKRVKRLEKERKANKFRITFGSILISAVPIALYLVHYLSNNPLSSLFNAKTLEYIAIIVGLSLVCMFFMFLAGTFVPMSLIDPTSDNAPDTSAWCIGGGVTLALFVMLLFSTPVATSSTNNPNKVDARSLVFFLDENILHYDPDCRDIENEFSELRTVMFDHANAIDIYYKYGYCAKCFEDTYLDTDNSIVHISKSCPFFDKGASVEIDELYYWIIKDNDLCPLCY